MRISIALCMLSQLFLVGCAFNPQQVELTPQVAVAASNQGKSIALGIKVLDERSSNALGHRGAGPGWGDAAEITLKQDLAVTAHQQVVSGFTSKGFVPGDFNSVQGPKLSVEIRELEYTTSQGFWTGGVHVKGALKAVATKGGASYDRLYRVEKEERVIVSPTAESNQALINTAFSELLAQLFADEKLIAFLAPTQK